MFLYQCCYQLTDILRRCLSFLPEENSAFNITSQNFMRGIKKWGIMR